jgi:inorganic triphosphatase YgiF
LSKPHQALERTNREIEFKLELEPCHIAMLRAHSLFEDSAGPATRQVSVYYDSPHAALRKHGYTFRVRKVGDRFVQTIKPVTAGAGLIERAEFERPVASLEPDLAALADTPLERLAKAGQMNDLEPVLRSEVERTSWTIEIGGSWIQADFDEGTMHAGGRSQDFVELELELVSGEPAGLLTAAKTIAERVPVRIGVLSKAERGARFASGAFDRVTKAAAVQVDDGMTVAETFEVMVHACLKHYRLNEPLVIDTRKKEALHQCRVAMRRLRSAFTLFKSAIADVEYHYLRQELRWFTGELGDARNFDVYLERDLFESEREAVIGQRELAYDRVIAAMNSHRFRLLLIELLGWAAFGPWRSGKQARKPVGSYAEGRLDRLWGTIVAGRHQMEDLDEHHRHRLRIQVKKMRYASEFLRGLYPDSDRAEKRFADSVENLQESLGRLNDLATARMITAAPANDDWLIGEPEERIHLREADRAFRDLIAVGPFWRREHAHRHHEPA